MWNLSYILLFIFIRIPGIPTSSSSSHSIPYHNQFALQIRDEGVAVQLGERHGLRYIGPIFRDYHLYEVPHISKRSLDAYEDHGLSQDPQILWYEQQVHTTRRKRGRLTDEGWDISKDKDDLAVHPSDPLFERQWFLNEGGHDGSDMNVLEAWRMGFTGKGVVVTILDDGIQSDHPDLAPNYDPLASTDINGNDDDPSPSDDGNNKHGTRCAGEVAAVAYNEYCGVGVAYNASIGGVRMLDGIVNDAVEARALSLNPDHIDIYSASWGPEDDGKTVDGPGRLAKEAFLHGIHRGRSGKGSIFIWASGNGGRRDDNCNCDGYTNSIFTLSISSATQGGYKPWYLEECSSTLATTYSSGTPSHDASITTVDQDKRLRPEKLCTSSHTGTSASAPLAAGIAALALEANPLLTWRDMQYLVVSGSNPLPLLGESGWYVNGVGRHYSHKFGYGLMSAGAMVKAALKWKSVGPQLVYKSFKSYPNKTLRHEAIGEIVVASMLIEESKKLSIRYLEHVQAVISLSGSPRGSLELSLISPSGTRSILLMKRPRDTSDGSFEDWPFLTVHFWGESPIGKWTLEIKRHEDVSRSNNGDHRRNGLLKDWQLVFYGVEENPLSGLGVNGTRSNPLMDADNSLLYESDYELSANESLECVGNKCILCSAINGMNNINVGRSCVENCPNKTFPSPGGGHCKPCHPKCHSCYGPQLNQCLTCRQPLRFVPESSSCHKVCPSTHFLDGDYNICRPCFDSKNCQKCSPDSGNCSACKLGFFLTPSGLCSPYCPSGYYSDAKEMKCSPCHETCEECSGPKSSHCASCPSGSLYHERSCLKECPVGHYANLGLKECSPCQKGCLSCSQKRNPRICTLCEEGWVLLGKKCYPSVPLSKAPCPKGSFYDNKASSCATCHDLCGNCFGHGPDHCLSCNNSYQHITSCLQTCPTFFTYAKGHICEHCPHSCRSCSRMGDCSLCKGGHLLTSEGRCVPKCPRGHFPSKTAHRCQPCHRNCESCFGERENQCLTCGESLYLNPDGLCTSECPEGLFIHRGACRPCHGRCANCTGPESNNCSSCSKGLYFDGEMCWSCKYGEYFDSQTCRPCHDSCRQCSGPRGTECLSCRHEAAFNPWNHSCVPCCEEFKHDQLECCECNRSRNLCLHPLGSSRKRSLGSVKLSSMEELRQSDGGAFYIFTVASILFLMLVYFIRRSRLRMSRLIHRYQQGYTKVSAYEPGLDNLYLTSSVSSSALLSDEEDNTSNKSDDEDELF